VILLRLAGLLLLILLLVNPTSEETTRTGPTLVLLDRSLSMKPAATDTARRLAGGAGTVLAFGEDVAPLDSATTPVGASRLVPALIRAAAWGGPAVVVTDGEVDDLPDVPPDLLARVGVSLVPRDTVTSAALLDVHLPASVSDRDTVRVRLVLGAWGPVPQGTGTVSIEGVAGTLVTATVPLPPPGGTARHEVTFPATRLRPGAQALVIRLRAGSADREPRDDARTRVITRSPIPEVVVLAAPADWEARFLASALRDMLEVPGRAYVRVRANEWRDAATLGAVPDAQVREAARQAAVVVWRAPVGAEPPATPARGGLLRWVWPRAGGSDDWYVSSPPPSPVARALAGVRWDSLPPLAGAVSVPLGEDAWVGLTARQSRRGEDRPVLVARETGGRREVTIAASGMWNWAFRGGADAQAYRAVVSAALDWLLGERAVVRDPVRPVRNAVPLATPLAFARSDTAVGLVPIRLTGPEGEVVDTLRFGPGGVAELRLPAGVYAYVLGGGAGRGVVAVEEYSDEFRPRAVLLAGRSPPRIAATVARSARERVGLFALVLALLIGEWAWRRRRGLP
jgi:hypothetical protein